MFTKTLLLASVCLMAGCSQTPAHPSFPKPPEILMQPPVPLVIIDPANKVKPAK